MVITKNRQNFKNACAIKGALLRQQISKMSIDDPYIVIWSGGMNTWKSLGVDAMICGIVDNGHELKMRQEMMFESREWHSNAVDDDRSVQYAQDQALFKFLKINGQTTCVIFTSDIHFLDIADHFGRTPIEHVLALNPELKKTDVARSLLFISGPEDLEYIGNHNVDVVCPYGKHSETRHLTFS